MPLLGSSKGVAPHSHCPGLERQNFNKWAGRITLGKNYIKRRILVYFKSSCGCSPCLSSSCLPLSLAAGPYPNPRGLQSFRGRSYQLEQRHPTPHPTPHPRSTKDQEGQLPTWTETPYSARGHDRHQKSRAQRLENKEETETKQQNTQITKTTRKLESINKSLKECQEKTNKQISEGNYS